MAISHAPGLRGMPSVGHCSRAAMSASFARSSARPRSRTMRATPAMTRADSILQTASIAGEIMDLADFDDLVIRRRATLGPFHGFLFGFDLNQPVAADNLFGFGERPVLHSRHSSFEGHPHASRRRMEAIQGQQNARLAKFVVVLHHLRDPLRIGHRAGGGLFVATRNHDHHESHDVPQALGGAAGSSYRRRISVSPSPATSMKLFTYSIACSFESARRIARPPISSFASVNGPSLTANPEPFIVTRAPNLLGAQPSALRRPPD